MLRVEYLQKLHLFFFFLTNISLNHYLHLVGGFISPNSFLSVQKLNKLDLFVHFINFVSLLCYHNLFDGFFSCLELLNLVLSVKKD